MRSKLAQNPQVLLKLSLQSHEKFLGYNLALNQNQEVPSGKFARKR